MVLTAKTIRANPFRVTVVVLLFWLGYYTGSLVRIKPTSESDVMKPNDAQAVKSSAQDMGGRESSFEMLRNQVNGKRNMRWVMFKTCRVEV